MKSPDQRARMDALRAELAQVWLAPGAFDAQRAASIYAALACELHVLGRREQIDIGRRGFSFVKRRAEARNGRR
jgi:hypothetical protein